MACTVPGCSNRVGDFKEHGDLKENNAKVSFHRFPADNQLKNKWIKNVRKGYKWRPTQYTRICSGHFEESCFREGYERRVLHSHAVPTIFPKQPVSCQPAPTTKPKAQKPSASASCEQEKKTKVNSSLPIIAKVYLYLEKEYEYIKTLNGNNCDLSPLADILKRTAEATDASEEDVISILDAEDLSDHLPPRARSKRRKILQLGTENNRENDLIEDDDILQEENDNVTVKLEITEDTESQHRLTNSSCNIDYGTPATDVTQVKSEPQVRVCPQTDSIRYLEVSPLTSTSGSNNSVEYTIQTRVKLEREEDETMTDNLLLPKPGSNNSVEDTTQTRVKPEEDEITTDNSLQPKSNPSNEPATLEPADTAIKLEPEYID